MTTNADITRAIKKLTGHADVKVHCADGVSRFYSDTNEEAMSLCAEMECLMLCRLNMQPASEWASDFAFGVSMVKKQRRENYALHNLLTQEDAYARAMCGG